MLVSNALQISLLVGLVAFGCCGNIGVAVLVFRTNLGSSHIALLAAIDLSLTVLGPGIMLVSHIVGPNWLGHDSLLCQSLSFLSTWALLSGLLVLLSLAVFLNRQKHCHKRKLHSLAIALFAGLLVSVLPFLGWSSFDGVPQLCTSLFRMNIQSISCYSIFYLLCSFVVLSITTTLSIRATRRGRLYHVQFFWKKHKIETRINEPEVTTWTESSTSFHSRLAVGTASRHSSFTVYSGRRSGMISAGNSPTVSSRASHHFPRPEGHFLGDQGDQGVASKEVPKPRLEELDTAAMAPSLNTRNAITASNCGHPLYPFTHSLSTRPVVRKIFKNPEILPVVNPFQKQRSISRFLLLRCCVSLICWLSLYTSTVLQLLTVHYPQELHVLFLLLLYIQSSTSPLLLLCDASYRKLCCRVVSAVFKSCSRDKSNPLSLTESRDMEYKVEGTHQAKLRSMKQLEL